LKVLIDCMVFSDDRTIRVDVSRRASYAH
jgi:hypothetical protein